MKNYPYIACVETKNYFLIIYNSDTIVMCFIFIWKRWNLEAPYIIIIKSIMTL